MAFTSTNGRTESSLAEINITPLVDVVLVLLIIFMVTAPILQSGIEVNVPQTKTGQESEDWRGPVGFSVALHALLFGTVFMVAAIRGSYHGETWGGSTSGGGAMSATLVSSIPLPRREAPQENVLATENPGLTKSPP